MRGNNQSCDQAQEQFDVHELGLGPLDPAARKQMELHFDDCQPCRKWLSDWELIKLDTHELVQLEVPSTVLSSIMAKIEPAPSEVASFEDIIAMVPILRSDALIAVIAFAALLLAGFHYASEGFEGTAAWCAGFIVLFLANHLSKAMDQEPLYKT